MTAPPNVFEGAGAKIQRARDQTNALKTDFQRFYDREPYTIHQPLNTETGRKSAVYAATESFPLSWSVIIGEIMHDLRSALDNAIYEMTCIEKGHPLSKTEFPVFEDSAKYDSEGVFKIRGINDAAKALVREMQPFERRKTISPDQQPSIALLHELNIIDKHRTIHLCRRQTTDFSLVVLRDIRLPWNVRPPLGKLEDGAVVADWAPTIFDDEPDVKIKVGFEVGLADTLPILEGQPVIKTCESLIASVDRLIFVYLKGTL